VNRKADFFYKTNRFESIRVMNRMESIRIANWNALPAARRVRIVSTRRTVDEYDTSRYQEATASARIIDDRCSGTAAEHHRCSQSLVSRAPRRTATDGGATL